MEVRFKANVIGPSIQFVFWYKHVFRKHLVGCKYEIYETLHIALLVEEVAPTTGRFFCYLPTLCRQDGLHRNMLKAIPEMSTLSFLGATNTSYPTKYVQLINKNISMLHSQGYWHVELIRIWQLAKRVGWRKCKQGSLTGFLKVGSHTVQWIRCVVDPRIN